MGRIIPSLIAFIVLMATTLAYGADATGAIKVLDAKTRTVTLDNGQVYAVSPKIDLTNLWIGEKVTVTYEPQDGKNTATTIAAAG
jgi:Cu/Ag efflux protein CusF